MAWIIAHWDQVLGIITGAVTLFSLIAKLTPTEVDDKWVAKMLQVVDFLAMNNKPTELKKPNP